MKLQGKILFGLGLVLMATFSLVEIIGYQKSKKHVIDEIRQDAREIRGILMATRRVYHHQFIDSGLPLSDQSLGFLPAHALSRISNDFQNWSDSGLSFNNVSDKARNPENQADAIEMEAIHFFQDNPQESELMRPFLNEQGLHFYHYANPIWIEPYCLECHGEMTAAPDIMQDRHTASFDYKLGELRGILSIKLPAKLVEEEAMALRKQELLGNAIAMLLTFAIGLWLLQRTIIDRLDRLKLATSEVAKGNYDNTLIVQGNDELSELANSFNEMAQQRLEADKALQESHLMLEKRVADRTRDLRVANQKLKALDQMKSMFVASMSHELRTPLNSIIGFSSMLLQEMAGPINTEQKDYLQRVVSSSHHLLSLITEAIDISKIEAGKIDTYPEHFNLSQLIHQVVLELSTQIADKGLDIRLQFTDELSLFSDRKRLEQCLRNMLENAVKYTRKGEITIQAREHDEVIEICVSDTGIGISPEDFEKIFQPFERLKSTMQIQAGGTGLGLYLIRKIATELLGGSISVTSQLGKGSQFILRLPKILQQPVLHQ